MKVLFVANTDMHINLCYLPYIEKFKMQNYCVDVATNTDVAIKYANDKIKIPISRSPFHFGNIVAIIKLRKYIKNNKYDLILCSTPMGGVVARLANFKYSKIIYTAHGFHFFKGNNMIKNIFYLKIEKILSKLVDLIITINEEDFENAKKYFKCDVKYIKGIGFDKNKFKTKLKIKEQQKLKQELNIKKTDYVITYVAEISRRKRQIYLLKCLKNMDLTNIKILLVGGNLLKNRLSYKIKKYKLENNVIILGFRNDVSNILDITDLVISVSKQEGLPLNIMEAISKNKKILATSCRGNRDLIKLYKNGVLVDIKDKDRLIYYIENMKNKKTVKQNFIDEYSVDKILPEYFEVFDTFLRS